MGIGREILKVMAEILRGTQVTKKEDTLCNGGAACVKVQRHHNGAILGPKRAMKDEAAERQASARAPKALGFRLKGLG